MSAAKVKYTLFSASTAEANGGKAPCAFFASPEGCRSGAKCRFAHVLPGAPESRANTRKHSTSSSSVVSSESEGEVIEPTPKAKAKKEHQAAKVKHEEKKKPKKKRKSIELDGDNIFASPKSKIETTPKPQSTNKKQKRSEDRSSTPATGNYAAMANNTSPPPNAAQDNARKMNQNERKKVKAKQEVKKEENVPNFLSLNLPIASFSIPSANKGAKEESNGDQSDASSAISVPSGPVIPFPNHTPTGRKWQNAITQTRAHSRYDGSFDFKKLKENDKSAGRADPSDWIKAKPYGSWCASNPQAIAIDCEMCETRNPKSGVTDSKALCRISIVNAENSDEVLLDTLVKPAWPVVDHRTWVNGINREHLENVKFTLDHAQAFIKALCSEETIITGHALHNDLSALKMEHHCNADSACLFTVKDAPDATTSLKDLALAVLKKEMPNTHDSVNDARTALHCLEHYLERDGKVDPVERTSNPKNRINASQLFIHRIPKVCQPSHLQSMFLVNTSIQPSEVDDVEFSGTIGKTYATFSSPRHANLAFETLEGTEEADKSGRMQKKVYLRNGDYVRVRKMVMPRERRGSISPMK